MKVLYRIRVAWRLHRSYLLAICLLLAFNLGAFFYLRAKRAAEADAVLRAKIRVWYVRQSFVDVRDLPGGQAILDTLVVNGLDSAMAALERLPDSAR